MQLFADPVADKGAHHRVTGDLRRLLNRKAKIAQPLSRVKLFDTFVKRLLRNLHQASGFLTDFANADSHGGIAVEAIVDDAIIQTDDVPLARRPARRNSMNDLFIHRYAKAPRKYPTGDAVAFERRDSVSSERKILGQGVQLQSRHSRRDFLL